MPDPLSPKQPMQTVSPTILVFLAYPKSPLIHYLHVIYLLSWAYDLANETKDRDTMSEKLLEITECDEADNVVAKYIQSAAKQDGMSRVDVIVRLHSPLARSSN